MKYFSILFAGALVTSLGSGMTAFGLAAWTFQRHHTAASVGLVQLCAFAPMVLLAPLAGALGDRFDRRLLMMLGDGGSALGLLVVLAAVSRPDPAMPLVLTGVTLSSCFAALTEPALRATVSDLVAEEDFVRASGMLQLAASAKFLLSPLLAGLLLHVTGLRTILLIDISTVLFTVGCTVVVSRALGTTPARRGGDLLADLREGLQALLSRRAVAATVAVMSLFTLFLGTLQTLVKPVLLPHYSVRAVGIAETLCAAGMVAGALLVSLLKKASPVGLLQVGMLGAGGGMVLAGLRPRLWWVTAACFLVFVFLAATNAGAEVLVRTHLPAEVQARGWGLIGLVSQLGFLIAYVAAGPLADQVLQPLTSGWLGSLVGTGPGRGAAALISLVGLLAIGLTPLTRLTRTPSTKEPHDARATAAC